MKRLYLFCAMCLMALGAIAQTPAIDAVKVEQGITIDWYMLTEAPTATPSASGISMNGTAYDYANGPITTTFGTAPLLYTRTNLSDGKWGTICLDKAVADLTDVTATFYKLNYYDGGANLYVSEVTELEAGHPYVFEAHAASFTLTLTPGEPAEAQTINGLIGTITGLTMEADAYALVNNMVVKAATGTTVPANRAYIDLTQVSTEPIVAAGAPRRIGVAKTPTELEQSAISNQQSAIKVLKGGQLMIMKEGKTYNAQGTLIIEN